MKIVIKRRHSTFAKAMKILQLGRKLCFLLYLTESSQDDSMEVMCQNEKVENRRMKMGEQ